MEKLTIIRGDDVSITLTYTDADGVAIDITGYSVFLTAKDEVDDDATDADAIITKKVTVHSDPTNGETVIALTDADTDVALGDYFADIQVVTGTGDVASSDRFILTVRGDVTRRIT